MLQITMIKNNGPKYIMESQAYNLMSPNLSALIKVFQIRYSIQELSFIDWTNIVQIRKFVKEIQMDLYMEDDIILKQSNFLS